MLPVRSWPHLVCDSFFSLSLSFLRNHAFSSARVTVRGMANPIRDFFRGNEGPVRPHNPRLSRDLRMHNACGREMVQREERAGKMYGRGRRKGDMQAKVIRSSLQGTRRSRGEG